MQTKCHHTVPAPAGDEGVEVPRVRLTTQPVDGRYRNMYHNRFQMYRGILVSDFWWLIQRLVKGASERHAFPQGRTQGGVRTHAPINTLEHTPLHLVRLLAGSHYS